MTLSASPKDNITENIRQQIGKAVPEAVETDRAEASLCSLSFQSTTHPERQIWIDTDEQHIQVDLEDWQDETEWDNAVERTTVESVSAVIDILKCWFSGGTLNRSSYSLRQAETIAPNQP
jgi:hypothetical protein